MAEETTARREANRRVQFPEAGDGVELMFRNSGLRVLSNQFGTNYLSLVVLDLSNGDISTIEKCLDVCVWKDGKPFKIDIDDLDHISLSDLTDKLLDAWSFSISGMSFADEIAKTQKEMEEKKDGDGPLAGTSQPGSSSDSSSKDTAQA